MPVAFRLLFTRQGNVDGFGFQFQFLLFFLQILCRRGNGFLHGLTNSVCHLTHYGALFGAELTHLFQNGCDLAFFA